MLPPIAAHEQPVTMPTAQIDRREKLRSGTTPMFRPSTLLLLETAGWSPLEFVEDFMAVTK